MAALIVAATVFTMALTGLYFIAWNANTFSASAMGTSPGLLWASSAQVAIALALVGATIAYTVFTARMAKEMGRERDLRVRPRLALDIYLFPPHGAMIAVHNVGAGAAVNAHLRLVFKPTSTGPAIEQPCGTPVLRPGEMFLFKAPGDEMEINTLGADYESVELEGLIEDAHGCIHEVSETLDINMLARESALSQRRTKGDPRVEQSD